MEQFELDQILAAKSESSIIYSEISSTSSDGQYICDKCGKTFKTPLARQGHMQKHLGRYPKKESTKVQEIPDNQIPTTSDYLSNLLQMFGVPSWKAVKLGMEQTQPDNIGKLHDLLRSVSTPVGKVEQISELYREHLGIKSEPIKEELKPQPKDSLDDILFTQERMLRIKMLESIMVSKNNGESSEVAGLKAQIQEMKDLLVQNQLKNEIEKLKEEKRIEIDKVNETLKKNREDSEGQMGSIASSLKVWMGENEHRWQMFQKDETHRKELESLKEEIRGSKVSNYMEFADKVAGRIENTLNAFGSGFGSLAKRNLDVEETLTRGTLANQLLAQGIPPDKLDAILGNTHPIRPPILDARREWEALKRAAENQPSPSLQPEPEPQSQPQAEEPKKIHFDYSRGIQQAEEPIRIQCGGLKCHRKKNLMKGWKKSENSMHCFLKK